MHMISIDYKLPSSTFALLPTRLPERAIAPDARERVLIKLRRLLSILLQYHTTAGDSKTKILHTEMPGIQIGNECFMK